jgi:hypothetical protein
LPDVAATIARSAVANRTYGQLERQARRALKAGDLSSARQLAAAYYDRLNETEQTLAAARNVGAKLPADLATLSRLQRNRLDALRAHIARELKRQQAPAR